MFLVRLLCWKAELDRTVADLASTFGNNLSFMSSKLVFFNRVTFTAIMSVLSSTSYLGNL